MFKRHWWRFWHVPGSPLDPVPVKLPDGSIVRAPVVPLPYEFDTWIQSWDLTFKETATGSYVVGQVWSKAGNRAFLRDQVRERRDFVGTLDAIRGVTMRWPMTTTKLIEEAANGPAVISALRDPVMGVPGIVGVKPRGSKEARASAVTAFVRGENVYLPHPTIAPWVGALIEECAAFPNAANDDQVDALSQAIDEMFVKGAGNWEAAFAEAARW